MSVVSRTYTVDSGLIAISATGATPGLYIAPTATNDLYVVKYKVSIEAAAGTPSVPSNSSVLFTLNKVTGTKAGGAAVTPEPSGAYTLAANTVFDSGSTALTGLTQSTEYWAQPVPFTAGAFATEDLENTGLENYIPASGTYCVYFNPAAGPGAGSNLNARIVLWISE
jgi:hypothetical protein